MKQSQKYHEMHFFLFFFFNSCPSAQYKWFTHAKLLEHLHTSHNTPWLGTMHKIDSAAKNTLPHKGPNQDALWDRGKKSFYDVILIKCNNG